MSTEATQGNSAIGLLPRVIGKIVDNGQITVAILILGFISWVFYNWINENNRQREMRERRLEMKYDALDKYVRNQFTPTIEKNNRILERVAQSLEEKR